MSTLSLAQFPFISVCVSVSDLHPSDVGRSLIAHALCDVNRIGKTFPNNSTYTTTESSGSSSSPPSSVDGESESGVTSPDEGDQEPLSILKRCDECNVELGEKETCVCIPAIAIASPSPPRAPSPTPSTSSTNEASSTRVSNGGQIPDEAGRQVEITQVEEEADLRQIGESKFDEVTDPWGQTQEGESQWKDIEAVFGWTELQGLSSSPATSAPSLLDESDEASTSLSSSDGRMTLTMRNFLGAGSYGKVVSADWVEGHRQVAIKVSHKLFISELDCAEPGLRTLRNELEVLKALKQSREYHDLGSNFFPELFKSWQDANNVYFVMDIYPWNLEQLRWADPSWDVTTGDKILWTAEMVCLHFVFGLSSRSQRPTDSWCSGTPPDEDPAPRHQTSEHLYHGQQAHNHRGLRSRAGMAGSVLRRLPIDLPEGP